MELTRRDALAALTAGGVTVGGAVLTWDALEGGDGNGSAGRTDSADGGAAVTYTDHEAATLVALAEVLFPTAVEGIGEFVETYAVARARDRPAHAAAVKEHLGTLDDRARAWHGDRFRALHAGTRNRVLEQMGLDGAAPDPTGQSRERQRYYLVNELLYGLYASPTGGRLVGIENPQGYPGGTESYQRGSAE